MGLKPVILKVNGREIRTFRSYEDDDLEKIYEDEIVRKIKIFERIYKKSYIPELHDELVIALVKSACSDLVLIKATFVRNSLPLILTSLGYCIHINKSKTL